MRRIHHRLSVIVANICFASVERNPAQSGACERGALVAAAAAHPAAWSCGRAAVRGGFRRASFCGRAKDGKLQGVPPALALGAGDLCRLGHHDPLVSRAAIVAEVFVNGHVGSRSLFHLYCRNRCARGASPEGAAVAANSKRITVPKCHGPQEAGAVAHYPICWRLSRRPEPRPPRFHLPLASRRRSRCW